MADYRIARLDEIETIDDGRCAFQPVRQHFGITTFGITATTARGEGDRLVNEHDEAEPGSSEELYFVVCGQARFELDGTSHELPAGAFVCVPAGVKRAAFAGEAGTTLLAIGAGPPGQPFVPTGWERFAPLIPLFESGEYEEGAARAQALIADDPPYGALYYNTACFESRAGQTDAALAHLRRAIALSPELAESAREDEDLASLRDQPAFDEIIGD